MVKTYKVIVIGPQLAGKTTIVRKLKEKTALPLLELDEEIVRLNNGEWPKDDNFKNKILNPKIYDDVKSRDNIVFFTNYFDIEKLEEARSKGFLVIQLKLDLKKLKRRNMNRMLNEGYDDASKWFKTNLEFQKKIKEKGLVDNVINVDRPIEEIVNELLELIDYAPK